MGRRLVDGAAVVSEHSAGEPVWRRGVDQVQHRGPFAVRIGIDREDRAEQLALHQVVARIIGLVDGGTHEPAGAAVALAAGDQREVRVTLRGGHDLGVVPVAGLVDDRPHEGREVSRVAHGNRLGGAGQRLAQLLPERARHVCPRGCGALLPLVLEGAAQHAHQQRVARRRQVREDEILAAGFADQAWVCAVLVEIGSNGGPQVAEGLGGAGEVDAREAGVGHRRL